MSDFLAFLLVCPVFILAFMMIFKNRIAPQPIKNINKELDDIRVQLFNLLTRVNSIDGKLEFIQDHLTDDGDYRRLHDEEDEDEGEEDDDRKCCQCGADIDEDEDEEEDDDDYSEDDDEIDEDDDDYDEDDDEIDEDIDSSESDDENYQSAIDDTQMELIKKTIGDAFKHPFFQTGADGMMSKN